MLEHFKDFPGPIEINGQSFDNVREALRVFKDYEGEMVIKLNKTNRQSPQEDLGEAETNLTPIYRIKVKQYMIKPATPEFDFQDKWNKGQPMPLRIMVGHRLQETKGMYKMELWGEITEEITPVCMKCGKALTNKVSQYFGIGPECGGHNYTNPFGSDQELREAVRKMQEQLINTKWTGWVIKSAIEEEVYLGDREL